MNSIKVICRTVIPLLLAVIVALGLFWFMQWLIAPDDSTPEETLRGGLARVEIAPEREQQTTQTTSSEAPPPPTALAEAAAALPVAPTLTRPTTPSTELNFTPIGLPDMQIEASVPTLGNIGAPGEGLASVAVATGISAGDFSSADQFRGRRAVPISTRAPCFPKIAHERNIEGFVEVLFVVKRDGSVNNIRVVNANPKGVFEAAALEGVRTWYYDSKQLGGATFEVKQRIPFTLDMYAFNGARKC